MRGQVGMFTRDLCWTALAAAVMGCGGHTLDVGSMDGGSGTGDLGGGDDAGRPAGPVWDGTLENAQLSDGSNRLTMTLSVAEDGGASGTLLLGDGTLLQPPTDPDVGYPPGAQFPFPGDALSFFEGFPYTMRDGHFSGSRLTFRLSEVELWTQWCALETPYRFIPNGLDGVWNYACTPNWGFSSGPMGCTLQDPSTMQDVPIDCGKAGLCNSYACACSATRCVVSSLPGIGLSFDLTIQGASADGTISGELGNHSVHFERSP
jgi:hypothetical protein